MIWTDERIGALRKAVDDGLSGGQAGHLLGISRAAAIGKAYRLGLQFGGGVASLPAINKRGRVTVAAATVKLAKPHVRAAAPKAPRLAKPAPAAPRAPVEPPPVGGLALDNLGPHQCRYALNKWPIGMSERARFCGADAEGSYCSEHHRVCYTPRAKASGRPWAMDRAA